MDPKANKYDIHAAARDGRTTVFESLLNANPKLAQTKDDDDRLPIHWAVSYNQKEIVEILASQKNFDPDVQDGIGWTPLMMSSSRKEGDAILQLLLAKGASPNLTNNAGQTALHFAVSKQNIDVSRLLISAGATTRQKDRRGQVPLHRAAAVGNVPLIKLLLQHKSPVNGTDVDGMSALHHAISEGHGEAGMVLLREGAVSDGRDGSGMLAIQLAPDEKVRRFILDSCEREGIEITTS